VIRRLKDRIEELEETIRQITDAFRPDVEFINDLDVWPKHRLILRCLIARVGRYVTQDALHAGIYNEGSCADKRLHNFINTLRKRLVKHNVTIHTMRGNGYMITKEDAAKLIRKD